MVSYGKANARDKAEIELKQAIELAERLKYTFVIFCVSNFSRPDLSVAIGLSHLASICFITGDVDRMKEYASIAKNMFEQLNEKENPVYKSTLFQQLFIETQVCFDNC